MNPAAANPRSTLAPSSTFGSAQPPADDVLDIGHYLDILGANKFLIAAITAIALGIGMCVALFTKPVYEANLLVQVEDAENNANKSFLGEAASMFDVKTATSAEMEIIRSRAVIGRAVEATGQAIGAEPRYLPVIGGWLSRRAQGLSNPGLLGFGGYVSGNEKIAVSRFVVPAPVEGYDFVVTAKGEGAYELYYHDWNESIAGKVGVPLVANTPSGRVELLVTQIAGKPGAEFLIVRRSLNQMIDSLQSRLVLNERGKQSGVIDVALQDTDRARLAQILNAIGAQYVRQNVERKAEEAQKTLSFLDDQLPSYKKQMENSEEVYSRFRNQKGTVAFDEEAKLILATEVDRQSKLLEARQKRRELTARFTDNHPMMQTLDSQISALSGEIGGIQSRVKALPGIQQDAVRMERDVKVNTTLYQSLLNQAMQLRLVKEGKVGNARLLDNAVVPENPVKPKRQTILAVALAAGLLMGILMAFVRNAFVEQRIKDPDELEDSIGLPVFSTIPHSPLQLGLARKRLTGATGARLLALEMPDDPAVESLRSLRTAMQFAMIESSNNRVVISSATPGAGKSFVTANFAVLMALAGKKTLVIDADMRRGHMHQYFGLQRHGGLSELIAGSLTIQQTVHRNVVTQLDFLATGQLPPNPSELLTSASFLAALEKLSEMYELVIIDTPPVLVAADTATIAAQAGTVLLVARAGVSTMGELKESTRRLALTGKAASGLLLNAIDTKRRNFGTYKYGRYRYTNYNYESVLPEEQ